MAGILDNKTRVFDTIITSEGRRQLALGGINIHFATFTDGTTFYAGDIVSGSADATSRIYLEAGNLPQDQITFQADDAGHLSPFANESGYALVAGHLFDYTHDFVTSSLYVTGSSDRTVAVTGDALSTAFDGILTSSIDNFKKQRAIATTDDVFDDDGFAIGNKEIEFMIRNDRPIADPGSYVSNINHLEDIFADPRFSHLPNFRFLPPINRIDDESVDKTDHRVVATKALGNYAPWGRSHVFPVNNTHVFNEHEYYAKLGYSRMINFEPTSRDNTLFIQAFEASHDTMTKLDIIDFGTWHTPLTMTSRDESSVGPGPVNHIFFVGKLLSKPETNSHTFVHLFTMFFG